MIEGNKPITVSTLLTLYSNGLSSNFDGKLIMLEGFFTDSNRKLYGKYYYDSVISLDKQHKITTQFTERIKSKLVSGHYYNFQGSLHRSPTLDNESRINVLFRVSKVLDHKEDVQIVSKHEYDIIRARFDREFPIIHDIILNKFELGKKPTLDIITGIQSTSEDDYSNQLLDKDYYNIRNHKCNLSSKVELIEFLSTYNFKDSDLLIILRGGGSGLEVFDDIELCRVAIELSVPFITGIGHEKDKTMLQRVSDKGFSTPTSVGAFLQKTVNSFKDRTRLLKEKEYEMERFKKQVENDRLLISSELHAQRRTLTILWVSLVLSIIVIVYFTYLFASIS
jgi:exodeoxyribonuclease VII large subunit